MPLNTSHCLVQSIGSAMLMIRTLEKVFMKYDERLFHRIFRAVQVPVMTGIPTLYRHILTISNYDIEVISINLIKALLFEHSQPPY